VDDWPDMESDQRKRLLRRVFEEIVVGDDGVSELVPRCLRKRSCFAELRIVPDGKCGRSKMTSQTVVVIAVLVGPHGIVAFVEELSGTNTQGATLDEARANPPFICR
jgi:hypothetical protein